MKKIKYILFALILSIVFIPNVSAKSVEIKSITEVDKSNNTVIKSNPTHNGLEMNFDVAFKQKDDFVKYKVIIKNDTNTEYNISNDTSFNKSEYITYNYEVSGNLKPKGETTVYVTITYTNEVDSSLLVDGKYPETNRAVIQLLDKEGTPANPNTGQKIIIMIILISLIILLSTILIIKKKNKLFSLIIVSLFLVPTLVYAVETLKLTINVKVEIEKGYKVAYLIYDGFYTDSELEKYIKTPETTCSIYYINGEKYNYCTSVIIKDENLYSAGETATTKSINKRYFITSIIDSNNNTINLCEENQDGTFTCPLDTVDTSNQISIWGYDTHYNSLGYTYSRDDLSIMNFSNNVLVSDKWYSEGYFIVNSENAFTMPNHDVLFSPCVYSECYK